MDRAVAIGYVAAIEIRAGRWDEHRALAGQHFDADEFETQSFAAVAILDPGPAPEPFATTIALAEQGTDSRIGPAE